MHKFLPTLLILFLPLLLPSATWHFAAAAVDDLPDMTRENLFSKWNPRELPRGTSPETQGHFVTYQHEALVYWFGPFPNEAAARQAESNLIALRENLILKDRKFESSRVQRLRIVDGQPEGISTTEESIHAVQLDQEQEGDAAPGLEEGTEPQDDLEGDSPSAQETDPQEESPTDLETEPSTQPETTEDGESPMAGDPDELETEPSPQPETTEDGEAAMEEVPDELETEPSPQPETTEDEEAAMEEVPDELETESSPQPETTEEEEVAKQKTFLESLAPPDKDRRGKGGPKPFFFALATVAILASASWLLWFIQNRE